MSNLKQYKKLLASSVILIVILCCALALTGAFPMMPISASSTQQDMTQKKQLLTWEAVEKLVDGNLTYGELFDTYDYNGMGAGVYTYTFTIEDARPFSLIVISGDDINKPVLAQLHSGNNLATLDLNRENLKRMMCLREVSLQKEEAPLENQQKTGSIDMSPENAANLQETADQGENLWLLDPKSVASTVLGLKGGYFSDATGEAPSMTLEYNYEYKKVVIELYQPVKTGRGGIWLVKSYEFVPVTLNNSFSNDQDKEIEFEFDKNVESDSKTIVIKPSQIITASPILMEQIRQGKNESQKPVTGLFDTELDIKIEGSGVELIFSLCNISEETQKLNFDLGREFDFFVKNNQDMEVYRWSYGKEIYLPAISHHKLKKGEKITFSGVWDYKDNAGSKVLPGKYTIMVKMLPKLENRKIINPYELTAVKNIEVNYNE